MYYTYIKVDVEERGTIIEIFLIYSLNCMLITHVHIDQCYMEYLTYNCTNNLTVGESDVMDIKEGKRVQFS